MAEKLRNCPFCGSSSVDPEGWCGPICDDCGASAGESNKSPQENIAAWNTRAVDPLLKRLTGALTAAALSLETIEEQAGLNYVGMRRMDEVRGYAYSRATVARAALAELEAALKGE